MLVGINLLREGLDIPEVSLVAILDADKEGFLRSTRSLIQICGRASRNVNGTVIMYADRVTDSMQRAIEETNRRRTIQEEFNETHNITPTGIKKQIHAVFNFLELAEADDTPLSKVAEEAAAYGSGPEAILELIGTLEKEMKMAAKKLDFEQAAKLRDRIRDLKEIALY